MRIRTLKAQQRRNELKKRLNWNREHCNKIDLSQLKRCNNQILYPSLKWQAWKNNIQHVFVVALKSKTSVYYGNFRFGNTQLRFGDNLSVSVAHLDTLKFQYIYINFIHLRKTISFLSEENLPLQVAHIGLHISIWFSISFLDVTWASCCSGILFIIWKLWAWWVQFLRLFYEHKWQQFLTLF